MSQTATALGKGEGLPLIMGLPWAAKSKWEKCECVFASGEAGVEFSQQISKERLRECTEFDSVTDATAKFMGVIVKIDLSLPCSLSLSLSPSLTDLVSSYKISNHLLYILSHEILLMLLKCITMKKLKTLTKISESLFNLKFAAKDLERNAKKSEKSEKEEKVKLKKVGANES